MRRNKTNRSPQKNSCLTGMRGLGARETVEDWIGDLRSGLG
jgi:hypothetical protein